MNCLANFSLTTLLMHGAHISFECTDKIDIYVHLLEELDNLQPVPQSKPIVPLPGVLAEISHIKVLLSTTLSTLVSRVQR